jgi:N-formylglutamate deformylase
VTVPAAILHVPHSSADVPAEVRPQLLLEDDDLEHELRLMTDWHTDELFALPPDVAVTVRFPVSRLVVDVERFEDPEAERMEAVGMGAVYTKTSHGAPLRDKAVATREREALLARYYRPHHAALVAATEAALTAHGRCLIIDCHSFPSEPLPYELKASVDRWSAVHRPAVCIGTDTTLPPHAPFAHPGMHTPPWLRERAAEACGEMLARWPGGAETSIAFDRPFAGALVPLPYLGSDRRVLALMIELRRDLYMDEASGVPGATFPARATAVQDALRRIIA